MFYDEADRTKKRYCCSQCWGELAIFPDPTDREQFTCKCLRCNTETYVTKAYAERRRSESTADARDAIRNLKSIMPDLAPKGSEADNIKELFGG